MQQHYTYLCSSVILIYVALLYLFMQQHCLCSNLNIAFAVLIYAATLYLFMQQCYTYLRSIIAAALLMQQYYTYLRIIILILL